MPTLLFAISGASGTPLALALLSHYTHLPNLSVHLIVSPHARSVLAHEQPHLALASASSVMADVSATHDPNDMTAPPASGSWPCLGMIICPCSMSTLAAIAHGHGHTLIHRAADVTLKERRPLIVVPRESPLNRIHLTNMLAAHDAGATIMPFMPAYYLEDHSEAAQFRQFAGRVLDQFRIPHSLCNRWQGPRAHP